jgi:uncharacterized membrane protein YvbJ
MYCRSCGSEVNAKAIACPKCGVPPFSEKKFCQECGGETKENQLICVKCGVKLVNKGSGSSLGLNLNMDTSTEMPVPLLAGWVLNFIAWVLFFSVKSTFLEIIMIIICAGCIYIANAHVKLGTAPAMDKKYLSAKWLMYASIVDTIALVLIFIFAHSR